MMKKIVSVALLSSMVAAPALADPTNFSYSTLGASLGKVTLKDKICFSGVCYSELGGVGIGGGVQFANGWLVASLAGSSVTNSGYNTTLTSGSGALGLSVVKALGDKIDVQAGVASLSGSTEYCTGSSCTKYSDTGMSYAVGINVWFDENKMFAGSARVASTKYSKSSSSTTTTGLGLSYYPTQNHEIGLSFSGSDSATSTEIGYTYHFM